MKLVKAGLHTHWRRDIGNVKVDDPEMEWQSQSITSTLGGLKALMLSSSSQLRDMESTREGDMTNYIPNVDLMGTRELIVELAAGISTANRWVLNPNICRRFDWCFVCVDSTPRADREGNGGWPGPERLMRACAACLQTVRKVES